MLALGAVPAAAVVYLRRKMPESPRYQVQVEGQAEQAASQISSFTRGQVSGHGSGALNQVTPRQRMGLRAFLTNRRYLILLAGTAGTWFLLDYAYYGNTISTPQILSLISPHASTMTKIALQLAIFVVAALPGYVLAIAYLDRIGHRRLQLTGFAVMGLCFLVIAAVPGMTTTVAPFLLVYGVSYFFTEFGPNMTTFVMPSEIYPVDMRATGHGISRRRQTRRVYRRLPVPDTADLASGSAARCCSPPGSPYWLRADPCTARASRPQPGRHRRRHADRKRPASAGGRSSISALGQSRHHG